MQGITEVLTAYQAGPTLEREEDDVNEDGMGFILAQRLEPLLGFPLQ
jgi:hypothetical protein